MIPTVKRVNSLLPIHDILPALRTALNNHHEAVLEAPPGAGKTSIVPIELLSEPWLKGQKILLLEPRRVAAKLTAQRLADNLGEALGETVGYRIRLDSKIGLDTRIEVITEGVLTRLLQNDSSLEGVGLVIMDEFHERSLHADLGLTLCLYSRELFRELTPLKLLVMSATLDGEAVANILGSEQTKAPIIRSEGRQFPIHYHYAASRPAAGFELENAITKTIEEALENETGSLLVFLPGQREIRRVAKKISDLIYNKPNILLTPLYGDLSLQEQQRAIAAAPEGKRKIVLATSIAETSLTIEGVRIVIDSGLSRIPKYDSRTGLTRLQTLSTSQASSTQRAGRAGRMEPGTCYRLWPEHQQSLLAPQTPPEIEQADLTSLALQLFQWGVMPAELRWLTPPPTGAYLQARNLLVDLGALDSEKPQLTRHGEQIATLPMHPRFAHMVLTAKTFQQEAAACLIAAMLPERDIDKDGHSDINTRLDKLTGIVQPSKAEAGIVHTIKQQAQRFLAQLNSSKSGHSKSGHLKPGNSKNAMPPITPEISGTLIALAYPDRIAKQRPNQPSSYVLANGREATLPANDSLRQHKWLAVANSGGQLGSSNDRIYLASPLNPDKFKTTLVQHVQRNTHIYWSDEGRLIAEELQCIGKLVIQSKKIQSLSNEEKVNALVQWISDQGISVLPWNKESRHWQARVMLLHKQQVENKQSNEWPDVSDAALSLTVKTWLEPYLHDITNKRQLAQLDLASILQGLIPWSLTKQLDQQAPTHIKVPSGSKHAIDYTQTPPVLAVKLQEMFGCKDTPTINHGKTALVLHLLSPARRPLQVTQDLNSFWENSYQDVKKEMRGRYPKHPWPDDPYAALPTAKTKRHLS